jgi:hypothetical protein
MKRIGRGLIFNRRLMKGRGLIGSQYSRSSSSVTSSPNPALTCCVEMPRHTTSAK